MIDRLKQNEQQGDALFQQTTEVGSELLPELPAAGAGDGGARAARLRSAGRPWLSCIGLRGRNPSLMKSSDLRNWLFLGPLLHDAYPANLGVPRGEDISCANMFKIGKKWMLLCISHSLGCRYYLGDFKDEKYLPDFHALMSWNGNEFFAPESVLTRDGRRVMWAWLLNLPIAPSGVQSLPRELELPEDGVLLVFARPM